MRSHSSRLIHVDDLLSKPNLLPPPHPLLLSLSFSLPPYLRRVAVRVVALLAWLLMWLPSRAERVVIGVISLPILLHRFSCYCSPPHHHNYRSPERRTHYRQALPIIHPSIVQPPGPELKPAPVRSSRRAQTRQAQPDLPSLFPSARTRSPSPTAYTHFIIIRYEQ